ncbi:MAG TPA: alpha/beta hydrolase [Candidatus Saccharimonadales bacterium]|nr:alpha/beta hydrolase [Candidatus Saccharimonadales bacterium]
MGLIINKLAFPIPQPSYDNTLSHLKFIKVNEHYIIPVRHYHRDDRLKTILYSHSNSELISDFEITDLSEVYQANMCMYDYAGYGLHSIRNASEEHCYTDIKAVYSYLIDFGIQSDQIVLYGRSIGTGPSCYLAQWLNKQNQFPKIILVSPFKSIIQVVINLPNLPMDIFNNQKRAPDIKSPVLIIHGCQDMITSHQQSVSLSKLFCHLYDFVTIHRCGHHNLYIRPEYYDAIHCFIK